MSNSMKQRAFLQDIHQISSTAKEQVGTLRITQDGRKFRYAKAGGALSAGKAVVAATIAAAHADEAAPSTAVAVGTQQVTLTVTAGTAIAENQLRGGYLAVNDGTGEGHLYAIESNSAVAADGTSITIGLSEPIRKVWGTTTATQFTLVHSPWYGVTHSATEENLCCGVAICDVTSGYYCWVQTGGPALALMKGTPAVGSNLTLGSPAGSLKVITGTLDVDQPIVGVQWGTAGVDTEYQPVYMRLD